MKFWNITVMIERKKGTLSNQRGAKARTTTTTTTMKLYECAHTYAKQVQVETMAPCVQLPSES
jgi:hypothetical protein